MKSGFATSVLTPTTQCPTGLENTVRVWSVDKGKNAGEFDGRIHVYAASITADNRFVLTGGGDNLVRTWDSVKFREVNRFAGLTSHVYSVRATPDSRRIVAGSWGGEIRVWDIPPGKGDRLLGRQDESVRLIETSSDNRRIVTGNEGIKLTGWGLPK